MSRLSINTFRFDLGSFQRPSRSCTFRLRMSRKWWQMWQILILSSFIKSYLGFWLAYLHLTLAIVMENDMESYNCYKYSFKNFLSHDRICSRWPLTSSRAESRQICLDSHAHVVELLLVTFSCISSKPVATLLPTHLSTTNTCKYHCLPNHIAKHSCLPTHTSQHSCLQIIHHSIPAYKPYITAFLPTNQNIPEFLADLYQWNLNECSLQLQKAYYTIISWEFAGH